MNRSHNKSVFRNIFAGVIVCAFAAGFLFTDSGKSLMRSGASFFAPAVAESAIVPADNSAALFRSALEEEIYLPQEVDLTAGSDFISLEEINAQGTPGDLTAMLDGAGHQCNFRDHMAGAVALNSQPGCI